MDTTANRKLTNGVINLTVRVPGAPGTYRGPRFSWGGIISDLRCGGHRLFGPWRPGAFPPEEHDNVTGTAGEFGMGTADMPTPLGFDAAAPGGLFVKIGVGVLRRPDAAPYFFARHYEIAEAPAWEVQGEERQIAFRQRLAHDGYGYDYTNRIELIPDKAAFINHHTLTNTGCKPIHQTHYAHNFIVVDRQPVGPAYEVVFPFKPQGGFAADAVACFKGSTLNFRELLNHAVFSELKGFDRTAANNRVTVRHRDSGFEMRIIGDRPVVNYHFFAVSGAVCPEPFVELRLAPGETMTWQYRYDLTWRETSAAQSDQCGTQLVANGA